MYIFKEIRDYIFKLLFCNLLEIPLLSDISQQRLKKKKKKKSWKKIQSSRLFIYVVIYFCKVL